jgi:hypothetical protein
MSPASQSGLASLTGAWRLVSEVVTFSDTKERLELHGPSPDGTWCWSPAAVSCFFSPGPIGSRQRMTQNGPNCSESSGLILAAFDWMA